MVYAHIPQARNLSGEEVLGRLQASSLACKSTRGGEVRDSDSDEQSSLPHSWQSTRLFYIIS